MTVPIPPPPGGWTVTGQVETQELPPGAQNFVKGVKITFTTGYGAIGSVFVPYAQLTPQYASATIAARVAQLDAISTLTHTSAD